LKPPTRIGIFIESTASSLHLEEEGGAGGIFSTCLLAGAGKGKANG
jgi:hypothetical protein